MGDFDIDELNDLLKEKIEIEKIQFPNINQELIQNAEKEKEGIQYNFQNGEQFQGRMVDNKMISGLYIWPNGQQYKGDFSLNNDLHKGEIIFSNTNNKLIGIYNKEKESFEKCIYETDSYIYEGNIKRNTKHGKSSIKNKENENFYLFKGKYDEGKRKGKCEIITEKNGIKYKINGFYKQGKKNGNFKIYNLENDDLITECNFTNDIRLIEKDSYEEIRKNKSINCIAILNKEDKWILLMVSENYIFLYDVIEKTNLNSNKLKEKCQILDILILKDKTILLCTDRNQFFLMDIKIRRNDIDFIQIFRFQGRDNSSSIFSMRELQNGLIASGDCNNLIFWEKFSLNNSSNEQIAKNNNNLIENNIERNYEINNKIDIENNQILNHEKKNIININNNISQNENDNNININIDNNINIINNDNKINNDDNNNIINNEKNDKISDIHTNKYASNFVKIENDMDENKKSGIWDSIVNICYNCYDNVKNFIKGENTNEIIYCSLKELYHIDLTHTYSFIEIKEKISDKNSFILAVAQPDDEIVLIYNISFIGDNININKRTEIRNVNSIINRKNIMTYKDDILYIACKDSIKLIDINEASIINNVLFENISYINLYRNDFLLCGINKNKSIYNFEGKLIQFEIKENELIPLYINSQHGHEGSIIDSLIFNKNNEEYIITLGTDKKITITHSFYNKNIRQELEFPDMSKIHDNNSKLKLIELVDY